MRWLCAGPLWRGSDAGGLFKALARIGQRVQVVDEFYYLTLHNASFLGKATARVLRPLQVAEFNKAICLQIQKFKPDILLIYKGTFVQLATLDFAAQSGVKLVNFYPDVSMFRHGNRIPQCMPKYDMVFTTKTYGIDDLRKYFNQQNAFFVPHGFDPDVHRPLELSPEEMSFYGCDVSFIGTWSAKKERLVASIQEALPDAVVKIWGGQWNNATSPVLKNAIQGHEVLGDLFAVAMQASKINLGICHEQVVGASSGDLITARTFHIPACGGFMLHERNEESLLYFTEGEEAAFFESEKELVEKVVYYLKEQDERWRVAAKGKKRAWKDHSLVSRAKKMVEVLHANAICKS